MNFYATDSTTIAAAASSSSTVAAVATGAKPMPPLWSASTSAKHRLGDHEHGHRDRLLRADRRRGRIRGRIRGGGSWIESRDEHEEDDDYDDYDDYDDDDVDEDIRSLEVDYDSDIGPTRLYALIENRDWDGATKRAIRFPREAKTWVYRRRPDDDGLEGNKVGEASTAVAVRWRILPIHAAVAFGAPPYLVRSLLTLNADGASARDDRGSLPIHLACTPELYGMSADGGRADNGRGGGGQNGEGGGSSRCGSEREGRGGGLEDGEAARAEAVAALLEAFPSGAEAKDGRGWTPLELYDRAKKRKKTEQRGRLSWGSAALALFRRRRGRQDDGHEKEEEDEYEMTKGRIRVDAADVIRRRLESLRARRTRTQERRNTRRRKGEDGWGSSNGVSRSGSESSVTCSSFSGDDDDDDYYYDDDDDDDDDDDGVDVSSSVLDENNRDRGGGGVERDSRERRCSYSTACSWSNEGMIESDKDDDDAITNCTDTNDADANDNAYKEESACDAERPDPAPFHHHHHQQPTTFIERYEKLRESRNTANADGRVRRDGAGPDADADGCKRQGVEPSNGGGGGDITARIRDILTGPTTVPLSEADLLEPDEATARLIDIIRIVPTSTTTTTTTRAASAVKVEAEAGVGLSADDGTKRGVRRTNAIGVIKTKAFRGSATDRACLVATRGLIVALKSVLLSPSSGGDDGDETGGTLEQRRRCVGAMLYLSDLPLLRFSGLLSPALVRGGMRRECTDEALRRDVCLLLSLLAARSDSNRTTIGADKEVVTALVDIIDRDVVDGACEDGLGLNKSASIVMGLRSRHGRGDVDKYECIPMVASSKITGLALGEGGVANRTVSSRTLAMKVLLSITKICSVAQELVQPHIMSVLIRSTHKAMAAYWSSSNGSEAIMTLAILANLTRHPKNAVPLAFRVGGLVPLLTDTIDRCQDVSDEIGACLKRCAINSLRNLSCDRTCRKQLAWTYPRLLRTVVVAAGAGKVVDDGGGGGGFGGDDDGRRRVRDAESRLSAFHVLHHLSDEPANLLALMGTDGYMELLVRALKEGRGREDGDGVMQYLACDSLANLSSLMKVSAEKGMEARIQGKGRDTVYGKATWTPSLDIVGWDQWQ